MCHFRSNQKNDGSDEELVGIPQVVYRRNNNAMKDRDSGSCIQGNEIVVIDGDSASCAGGMVLIDVVDCSVRT